MDHGPLLTFDVLGYRADIAVPAGEAERAVRVIFRGFGPVRDPCDGERPRFDLVQTGDARWEVRTGSDVLPCDHTLSSALGVLEWRLVTDAVVRCDDLFHLHAAALCLPTTTDGLLLAGQSGRGKTTLTLGLMLRGFVPFADDVALIDPVDLALRAFPRAFHISDPTWHLLEPLGGVAPPGHAVAGYFSPPQWAERPVPVRWVLFPEYRPNQRAALVPLTTSEAAAAIAGETLSLTRSPRMALSTAGRLAADARCYRFLSGDLVESVAMVQQLVATGASRG